MPNSTDASEISRASSHGNTKASQHLSLCNACCLGMLFFSKICYLYVLVSFIFFSLPVIYILQKICYSNGTGHCSPLHSLRCFFVLNIIFQKEFSCFIGGTYQRTRGYIFESHVFGFFLPRLKGFGGNIFLYGQVSFGRL